jgi:ferredoxin
MAVELHVNPASCDGFGYCAEIIPELVGRDEWGFPVLKGGNIPDALLLAARQAVRFCPRRALALSGSRVDVALRRPGNATSASQPTSGNPPSRVAQTVLSAVGADRGPVSVPIVATAIGRSGRLPLSSTH